MRRGDVLERRLRTFTHVAARERAASSVTGTLGVSISNVLGVAISESADQTASGRNGTFNPSVGTIANLGLPFSRSAPARVPM